MKVNRAPPTRVEKTVPFRELAESILAGDDQDARRLAQLVLRALERPEQKIKTAFGLAGRRGGESASRAEARHRRDEVFRALAEAEGDLDVADVATAIVAKVRRYERGAWLRDRGRGAAGNSEHAALFEILESGVRVPGARGVSNILKAKK